MATRNALSLAVHTCIKIFFEKKNIYCFSVGAWLGFDSITFASAPCQYNLSFSFSNLAYSRKTQHESSKIFFEHASHVAKPNIFPLGTTGSVMDSGLSMKGCSHTKTQFYEIKQD